MPSMSSSDHCDDTFTYTFVFRSAGATEHDSAVDPKITLRKLDQSTQRQVDATGNHPRSPDLSANIKVVFPSEVYTGEYLNHGQSKTVFLLKQGRLSCEGRPGKFGGAVLKVSKKIDLEPLVFKQMSGSTPQVLYECWGQDGHQLYYCWVCERCIPLNEFANLEIAKKEMWGLDACRCIARAALDGLLLSDCHFCNLGFASPKVLQSMKWWSSMRGVEA